MAWVKDEIGRAVGLPASIGGIPLDDTGWGVRHAAEIAAPSWRRGATALRGPGGTP
jgi:glutamate dehydrogenase (NAD(P)+)